MNFEEIERRQRYREEHRRCELTPWIRGREWEKILEGWCLGRWLELHHILGRGKGREVRSNFIMLSGQAHLWCHKRPAEGTVLCLWVKMMKSRKEPVLVPFGQHSEFCLRDLDAAVGCQGGLVGHVEMLLGSLDPDSYFGDLARQIIQKCRRVSDGVPT